jgi:hypothetical protein
MTSHPTPQLPTGALAAPAGAFGAETLVKKEGAEAPSSFRSVGFSSSG